MAKQQQQQREVENQDPEDQNLEKSLNDESQEEIEEEEVVEEEEENEEEEGDEEELTPEQKLEAAEKENVRLRRELRKTRREAAKRRIAAKSTGKDKDGKPDPVAEELERLRLENEQLKTAQQAEKLNGKIKRIAQQYGFAFPEDVIGQIDLEDVAVDDEDFETIVKDELKSLAKRRPSWLAKKAKRTPDARTNGSQGQLNINEQDIAREFGISS